MSNTKNNSTLKNVLDMLNDVKKTLANNFYLILVWLLVFWLYSGGMFWLLLKIFNNLMSWKILNVWVWIIAIMASLILAYIGYWIFNPNKNSEDDTTLWDFIEGMWEDVSGQEDDETTTIILLLFYILLLGFYLFLWFYIWKNIGSVSTIANNLISMIISKNWTGPNNINILWEWGKNLLTLFLMFFFIKFVIKYHFKSTQTFKNKLASGEWIDSSSLILIVIASIIVFYIAVKSFSLIKGYSVNISSWVQQVINNTFLNQIK